MNIIVLWNTLYMTAAVERLKQHGDPVPDEDLARLSPLIFEHDGTASRYQRRSPAGNRDHYVIQRKTCSCSGLRSKAAMVRLTIIYSQVKNSTSPPTSL